MNKLLTDVIEFHSKFSLERMSIPTPLHRLGPRGYERLRHLREELAELEQAVRLDDLPKQADALVDLVYIALGTARMMGLPFDEIWDAVHAANMQKVSDPSVPKRVAKPAGWRDPIEAIEQLIGRQRGQSRQE